MRNLINRIETDSQVQSTDRQLSERGSLGGWVKKVKGLSKENYS